MRMEGPMRTLDDILRESASQLHSRLCPRQVLGARMGLVGQGFQPSAEPH